VMRKLARVGSVIVNMCGRYDLNEEDLPASLLAILGSLQRFVSLRRLLRSLTPTV